MQPKNSMRLRRKRKKNRIGQKNKTERGKGEKPPSSTSIECQNAVPETECGSEKECAIHNGCACACACTLQFAANKYCKLYCQMKRAECLKPEHYCRLSRASILQMPLTGWLTWLASQSAKWIGKRNAAKGHSESVYCLDSSSATHHALTLISHSHSPTT